MKFSGGSGTIFKSIEYMNHNYQYYIVKLEILSCFATLKLNNYWWFKDRVTFPFAKIIFNSVCSRHKEIVKITWVIYSTK